MNKNIYQKIIIAFLIISFAVGSANYSTAANNSSVIPTGNQESQISWAKERREKLLKLMETDPQSVINQIFPQTEINNMPEYIKPYMEKITTVSGTISIIIQDNFEQKTSKTSYELENDQERLSLYFAGKKPDLASGDKIEIKNAVRIGAKIAVPAPTNINLQISSKIPHPQSTTGPKKIAAILFNFQDNAIEHLTKEEVRKKIYDEAKNYYEEVTFNRLNISGYNSSNGEQDIYGWYTIPANASSGCNTSLWKNLADKAATENDNFNKNNYSNATYFFPENKNCEFGGLAEIGPLDNSHDDETFNSWYNGAISIRVVVHELGHNFGAIHASSYACYDENKNRVPISNDCTSSEYGDKFDVMGSGTSHTEPNHMNSFFKTQEKWFDAQNIQNVEISGTFTLFPIEKQSSSIQTIKIPRGTYSESPDYDDYYFLEYRRPYGYDNFKDDDTVVNGISIRLIKSYNPNYTENSYLIDNTPNSYYDDFVDSALLADKIFKDDIANIEIKTISVSNESAQVEIKTNYTAICNRQNPSISITPPSQKTQAGNTVSYILKITNNDSLTNCESSVFNITSTLPDNLSQSPSSFEATLKPKETKQQIIYVKTDETKGGIYEFIETAVNKSHPEFQQSIKAQIDITLYPPVSPSAFKVKQGECGSKSIKLTWNDVKGEAYYNLYRKDSDGGDKTMIIPQNTTSYTDTDLKEKYTYYYEFKACNDAGCSLVISKGPVKTPPECKLFKTLTIEREGNGFGTIIITNKSDHNKKTYCYLTSKDNNKCEYQFQEKSKLTLLARNSFGSIFKEWTGDCSGTSKTCGINMLSDKTIEAKFVIKK